MTTLPDRLLQSWSANADAWTDAVRNGAIESREAGTDAAIVEAVVKGLPPFGRVLDMGCGEGWLVRALRAIGVDARGIDASPELIQRARDTGGPFEVARYSDIVADPSTLGAEVDAVVFNFSILSDDAVGILRAATAVLEHGRVLIQTVHPVTVAPPYRDGWREESFASVDGAFEPMPWYFRTVGSWVRTLTAAGLQLVEVVEPLDSETETPLSLLLVAERS